jgi:Protein of unknown function, DUF547
MPGSPRGRTIGSAGAYYEGARRRVLGALVRAGRIAAAAAIVGVPAGSSRAAGDGFDHGHGVWDGLLRKHVAWADGGHASRVDYRALATQRAPLRTYLAGLSGVSRRDFDAWGRERRLAFLINAYNAYTVELVLTKYPDLASIRELGSVLRSPWKKRFIALFGGEVSLDDIEHGMIRARGAFDDPRIHMAVNCASIGCPALRPEAFTSERLDAQLDDGVSRFLSDRTRNRADAKGLHLSKIFDWYGADFAGKAGSVAAWLAPHADLLSDDPRTREALRGARLELDFLEYDWSLNAAR